MTPPKPKLTGAALRKVIYAIMDAYHERNGRGPTAVQALNMLATRARREGFTYDDLSAAEIAQQAE